MGRNPLIIRRNVAPTEIDGGKLFFPEERPEKLALQLRRHWGR